MRTKIVGGEDSARVETSVPCVAPTGSTAPDGSLAESTPAPEQEWTDGDYPTDAAIKRIENWPCQDIAGCLDFARSIWHWPDWASEALRPEERLLVNAEDGDRFARFATGGWSGNEEIILALMANHMVSTLSWRLHAVGGLHIYQYPAPSSESARTDSAVARSTEQA